MTNQDFGRGKDAMARGVDRKTQDVKEAASGAFAKVSDVAREVGSKAKEAASDTAFTVTEQVKEMLDRQIGSGASVASHFASSVKLAADDLDRNSPLLAGMVRSLANKVADYADEFQDQTVEHLARTAADFTRRQPALVFGLAALTGFFLFRTMKSAPGTTSSPSIQPVQTESSGHTYG
jgi:hydroxyethylthiazole kinase-like sugar kinase family protein